MAGEAELKIGSESIEKTTAALDSLITVLEKLLTAQVKQTKNNEETAKSTDAVTNAVKQSEIARNKAIALLDLEGKGLNKTSEAYTKLKGEILAQEVAAKKNINTSEADYKQLLENISAKEQAVAVNKELVASTNTTTTALKASEAASIKAVSLYELEQKGLDRLSDEYAELKAEILAKDIALRKGIDTESKEYQQILKTTKAQEVAINRTKSLNKSQQELNNSTQKSNGIFPEFSSALDDAAKQAQLVDGPLGGIASRITTLSSILKSGGLAFAAAGVGVAALTLGLTKGVAIATQSEVAYKQLEAQVAITGGTAGFTATQFDDLARSLAMSTLGTTDEMRKLISQLLVFDRVSGDAFTRAISLANDVGATGLSSSGEAVKKIGKALQDPLKYYTELAELGIAFNKTQVDAIKNAEAQGDTLKAQEVILTAIESKVSGIAKAQADSLAGDLDTFGQKWDELWEKASSNAMPIIRSITQAASKGLDLILQSAETDGQTALRKYKESQDLNRTSTKDLKSELERLNKELDDNTKKIYESNNATKAMVYTSGQWGAIEVVDPRVTAQEDLLYNEKEILVAQKKAVSEALSARESAKTATRSITLEQELYLESLSKEVESQRELNELFIKTGDTRSAEYRKAKVEAETLAIAREKGLEFNKEAVDQIRKEQQAKSDLTEENVAFNIALQKEKSLRGQQADLKKEIALNKMVAEGLQENSVEYLKAAALIDLRNKALLNNEPISGATYENLQKETIALVELQAEMKKIAAMRQFDSNSSTYKALEKSLELYELTKKGIEETSEAYIRESMAINARNVALQAGAAVGSEEYNRLLATADALATLQVKLQEIKDIESLGLKFDLGGNLIEEGSLSDIENQAASTIEKIIGVALSQGLEIDDPLIQKLFDDLNLKFQEGKNQILLPLGLAVDREGALYALETAQAVKVELDEKLREMDRLAKEQSIEDEIEYQERRLAVIREYELKGNDARAADYEKTEEAIALTRAMGVSNSISSIAEQISAAKGGNKTLAKIAKTAAVFQASAGLVKQLSVAATVEPYWAKFAAYAEATATGASIISMASGLTEPSFAFGGIDIQGAGTGRSDSIKANIARGESVVTASATSQYKDTLKRMNAGLPINNTSNRNVSMPLSINIQGDASENTVRLIDESLRSFEDRVQQISQGVSLQTIQSEQNYGGLLNQF